MSKFAITTVHEFSYFYFEGGTLKAVDKCSQLPDDEDLEFCKLSDAVGYVQKLGCCGMKQHSIRSEYHRLCIEVLRWAVKNTGQVFPVVFRGVRSNRAESEHMILFGTRDKAVAAFYGSTLKEYRNVRGILVRTSHVKSVKTDDWSESDDEIIFFPDL